MDKCKDCMHYSKSDFYKEGGYCFVYEQYVKETDACEDFEEGE